MRTLLLVLLFAVCRGAEPPAVKLTYRCYWSGLQTYTIFSDGHFDLEERPEYGRGRTATVHGTITSERLDRYLKLLRAVGFLEVSEESLAKDRSAAHGAVSVSDGLTVTIAMRDGAELHEVTVNSVEIILQHFPDSPSYAKFLHAKILADLLSEDLTPVPPQAAPLAGAQRP